MIELDSVLSVFNSLKGKKGIQIFIHGSCADNTTTAFSDIDDFVIIDDLTLSDSEIFEYERILTEIEYRFYKIDPIQHHGHFMIYKSSLSKYDNSFLPLFILDGAISVIGSDELNYQIDYFKTRTGLINNISITYKNIESFFRIFHNLNIYKLKGFVGSIVLMPPLLFQTKGFDYTKKKALNRCKDYFSREAYKVIQWATDVRLNWKILTDSDEYRAFIDLQEDKVAMRDWRNFAEDNSPVINSENLSDIILTNKLVSRFLKECLDLLNDFSLQNKSKEEYKNVYSEVEDYAIELGALVVGQFGEVRSPGISDLDVFVCFPDSIYKNSFNALNTFINASKERVYLFTHPVLCVCESMLPYIKYLHTISNLNITYNPESIVIDIQLNKEYQEFINRLWTLSLLPHLHHSISTHQFVPIREKLLLLKNVHTSIDNISELIGLESNEVEKSHQLRNAILKAEKWAFADVEKEFLDSEISLLNLINNETQFSYNWRFIVNRNFLIECGNYNEKMVAKKFHFILPYKFYLIIKDAFKLTPVQNEVKIYIESFEAVKKLTQAYSVPGQFLNLIPHSYKKAQTPVYKRLLFSMISRLPINLSNKFV